MKKTLILLGFILLIVGCKNNNNNELTFLDLEQIQSDPLSFNDEVSLRGFVDSDDVLSFRLTNESREFFIQVDYRGNQALPEIGEEIIVTGIISQSCCGLTMIQSINYKIVGVEE